MTQELQNLPHNILRDIARNDAADPRYRKAAVRLLLQAGSHMANIPDLVSLVSEVKSEIQAEHEVTDIVEQAVEEPIQVHPAAPAQVFGAPSASFTTSSMFRDDER